MPNIHQDVCLLCTSPVPADREDANMAYLAGFADGIAAVVKQFRRYLCPKHKTQMVELLEEAHGLTLSDTPVPPGQCGKCGKPLAVHPSDCN